MLKYFKQTVTNKPHFRITLYVLLTMKNEIGGLRLKEMLSTYKLTYW